MAKKKTKKPAKKWGKVGSPKSAERKSFLQRINKLAVAARKKKAARKKRKSKG